MSVQNSTSQTGETLVREHAEASGVYASLFEKINLTPVAALGDIDTWQDSQALADATADERVTAAVQVLLQRLKKSGQQVEKLDKSLLDHHIAELDYQISRQLDEVMHHQEFQKVESQWRGLKHLIDRTDFRQNVKIEILDISKVAAAAHMPFIGSVGPAFFLKNSMEDVAAIKDIGNYFDRAEYIKWKSFRDTDDSRYIGLTMPRVLGRLP